MIRLKGEWINFQGGELLIDVFALFLTLRKGDFE